MPVAQQLGRYQLLDRIAFGGMAEIYRAKTFDSEGRVHLVAVKRVLQHLTTDDSFLRMLVDEAKVSAALRHENIARVYEFSHSGDEYFMALEYVDGKDLRTLLERHRNLKQPIPAEHAAYVTMQVALGLHAAHAQRDGAGRLLHIVHRDVSPSNVLLGYHGDVKLCDFGIAKATLTRVQTKTGVIKGKVKYMSPEQALGRRLDHRSDLFSLGSVLYEMLTLQAPFQAATEVELIFTVRDANKRDARSLQPSIPADLNEILNRMMTRSRSARFQTGGEVAEALGAFLERRYPGYKRSTFGRFLRRLFEAEIEQELRRLEEWIIGASDPGEVGENLIAEVLGADAPYTGFTAAAPGGDSGATRAGTGRFPRIVEAVPDDLHNEQTRILSRNLPAPARPAESAAPSSLHEQRTRILDPGLPAVRDLSTQILMTPEAELSPGQAGAGPDRPNEEVTVIPDGSESAGPLPPLEELRTEIDGRVTAPDPFDAPEAPAPLHDLPTRSLAAPTAEVPDEGAETEAQVRATAEDLLEDAPGAERTDGDDALELDEDDLEPL